ncbi:MAG: transposase [Candidatus Microthrix subdominans]
MRNTRGTIVGLDVHKDTIAAACIDEATAKLRDQQTFESTTSGNTRLAQWSARHKLGRIGLEPSVGVGHGTASHLAHAYTVVLVPPRLSSCEAKTLRTRRKSDPTDAIAIARGVAREHRLSPFQQHGYATDLKLLVDHRDQLHHERTRVSNRLHALLANAYPGYQREIGRQLTSKRALAQVESLVDADPTIRGELAHDALTRLRELDLKIRARADRIETPIAGMTTSLTDIVGISSLVLHESSARSETSTGSQLHAHSRRTTEPRRSQHRQAGPPGTD